MSKLQKYNQKRDFKKTDEPEGKIKKEKKYRFVIQHHFSRKEHYDFRFEHDGVLVSFAVPKGLPDNDEKHLAVHVEDHPIDYINFEGEIPKGNYGAGKVFVFDKGTYTPLIDMQKGLKKGHIKIQLYGKKTKGIFNLVKTDEPNWLVLKSENENSSKKITNIKNPFNKCAVKLAKLSETIPEKNYIYEIKYDGYRIVSYLSSNVILKTRNSQDYTKKFPSIVDSLKALKFSAILDGEIVVFDKDGKSDFGLLNECLKNKTDKFCYVVFDILAYNGKDIRDLPLLERKKILKKVLANCNKNIIFSSFVKEKGKKTFELAQNLGLEGIVAKEIYSTYNGNRDDDWLKIKCYKRQEFIIGGYTKTDKNKNLSAIHVGYYKNKKLIYAGKVGTGFDNDIRKELNKKFEKITRKSTPFADFDDENAIWLTPKFVAEIQFAEFTKNNVLRQPSFIGLRNDKDAKKVILEKAKK